MARRKDIVTALADVADGPVIRRRGDGGSVAAVAEAVRGEAPETGTVKVTPEIVAKIVEVFDGETTVTTTEFWDAVGIPGVAVMDHPDVVVETVRRGFRIQQDATSDTFRRVDVPLIVSGAKIEEAPESVDFDEIDGEFYWNPPQRRIVEKVLRAGHNVALVGLNGCGKTELPERIAADWEWELYADPITRERTVDDYYGTHTIVGGDTRFNYAILPIAMKRALEGQPVIYLADEWDAQDAGVGLAVQRVLEGKDLLIPKTGEWVKNCDDFHFVATMNTRGRGDVDLGLFTNREVQDEATLDRFGVVIHVDYPPRDPEITIVRKKTGVNPRAAEKIVDIAQLARSALMDGQIMSTFSLRKTLNLARLVVMGEHLDSAFRVTVLERTSREDALALAEMYQRVTGRTLSMDV